MANKKFLDWIPQVQPDVPGCSPALVVRAVRNAARRFCEETTAWRLAHTSLNGVTDEVSGVFGAYDITEVPTGAGAAFMVDIVDPIIVNDKGVFLRSKEWLDLNENLWQDNEGPQPKYYYKLLPTRVRFVPRINATGTSNIDLTMILKPEPAATEIDDHVYNDFYEGIACGALAELLVMPKKPWTDVRKGEREMERFDDAINEARAKTVAGHSRRRADRRNRSAGHYF